jgi:hypothetical protein
MKKLDILVVSFFIRVKNFIAGMANPLQSFKVAVERSAQVLHGWIFIDKGNVMETC